MRRLKLTTGSLLQSLNLPASLQALEKPLGLPPSLTTHAEEIRQQDGLHKLQRSIHEIRKLKANDEAMYKEGVGLLETEAAEDEKARTKHGTVRWTRPPSSQAAEKVYRQVSEIEGYLKSAASSDELVNTKFKECESAIKILSGTKMDLEAAVPNSRRATLTPAVERAADNLRSALSDFNQLDRRSKKIIQELREKVRDDDISKIHVRCMCANIYESQIALSSRKQHASSASTPCRRSSLQCSRTSSKTDSHCTMKTRR